MYSTASGIWKSSKSLWCDLLSPVSIDIIVVWTKRPWDPSNRLRAAMASEWYRNPLTRSLPSRRCKVTNFWTFYVSARARASWKTVFAGRNLIWALLYCFRTVNRTGERRRKKKKRAPSKVSPIYCLFYAFSLCCVVVRSIHVAMLTLTGLEKDLMS